LFDKITQYDGAGASCHHHVVDPAALGLGLRP